MKKFIILLSVCLVIILCSNINLKWNNADQDRLGITLNNIEALATGENQEMFCRSTGSLDCPTSTIKVKYIF